MSSVKVDQAYARPRDTTSPMRWYVWVRGKSVRRKVRLEAYMAQMTAAGRTEHASNVLAQAVKKGYNGKQEKTGEVAAQRRGAPNTGTVAGKRG